MRFTTTLSRQVADTLHPLTDANQINAFVVDDSLFERTSCRKTELADITFGESFRLIFQAMFESIYTVFDATRDQIDTFIDIISAIFWYNFSN